MDTIIYQSGLNVIVEQNGITTSIPQDRCQVTYLANQNSDITKTIEFTSLNIEDILLLKPIATLIADVQNQSGEKIGSYDAVNTYLKRFILRFNSAVVSDDACTKANQEVIISQNEEMKELLDESKTKLDLIKSSSNNIEEKQLETLFFIKSISE